MPPVSIFLNILWILLGGLWMAAAWVVAAIIMAITIIGLPWAKAAFNIAVYTLAAVRPDGGSPRQPHRSAGYRHRTAGRDRQPDLAGAGRLVAGAGATSPPRSCWPVTIIGIPFAWAHLKLAGIALWPIGKVIVPA